MREKKQTNVNLAREGRPKQNSKRKQASKRFKLKSSEEKITY